MEIPLINEFKSTFYDPVWAEIARVILKRHDVLFRHIRRAEHGENIVFLIDNELVLKIYTPQKNGYKREKRALEFVEGKPFLHAPGIVADGEIEGFYYLITTQLGGESITRKEWLTLNKKAQFGLVTQLAYGLKELHSYDPRDIDFDWLEFLRIQVDSALDKQKGDGGNPEWIESIPPYFEKYLHLIPDKTADAFQHGDVHFGNIRVLAKDGYLKICGLFDFADSIKGFHEYEFIAVGVLMIQGQGELQREFFRAYGYKEHEIDETLRHRMMLLTMLYEYSSLRRYAERLRPEAVNYTLDELERAIWSFI
jgi:hygromycin-B 7''-O-kinase